MGQSEYGWTTEPSSSGGGNCVVETGYTPTSPAMDLNVSAGNASAPTTAFPLTSPTSVITTDANGNAVTANGAHGDFTNNHGQSTQRVHRRSTSRDPAPGGHGGTLHWFAVVGDEEEPRNQSSGNVADDFSDGDAGQCRPGSASSNSSPQQREKEREREERLRQCRERQEDDRRRKLEELKQHALAAQKFREQQEEERKRHIEEVRTRESQRRQQVEERKRQIVEADRERKEQIIKRKDEKDVRMDTRRRHERGQIVFAFGSSTPRMGNDPPSASVTATATTPYTVTDSPTGYWGSRKSSSSFNVNVPAGVPSGGPGTVSAAVAGIRDVMSTSFHQSSSVERPSSASRPVVDDPMTQSMSAIIPGSSPWSSSTASSKVRRRTDLTPTVPQSQQLVHRGGGANLMETSYHGSTASSNMSSRPSSASTTMKKVNRAVSLSRLDQLSQPRRGRPAGPGGGAGGSPQSASKASHQRTASGTDETQSSGGRSMSKSMVHLGPSSNARRTTPHALSQVRRTSQNRVTPQQQQLSQPRLGAVGGTASDKRAPVARSMSHLSASAPPLVRMTRAERLRMMRPRAGGQETNTQATPGAASSSSSAARSGATTPSTPSRPLSALSNASQSQPSSGGLAGVSGVVRRRHPPGAAAARLKPRPMSIAGTSVEQEKIQKTALQRRDSSSNKVAPSTERNRTSRRSSAGPTTPKREPNAAASGSSNAVADNMVKAGDTGTIKRAPVKPKPPPKEKKEEKKEEQESKETEQPPPQQQQEQQPAEENAEQQQQQQQQKPKITTEEGAKAAIAERRRLAREQAEREAEEQRRREEEEERLEEEQRKKEEEEHRKWAEEQDRLMAEARKAEEERLKKAIEEAERQAEEEKKRKEEEIRLKAEKEEQEKKAREEAEKQKIEREEALRKEMEEREARRKKVEEIMARTRGARGKKDNEDQSGPSSTASSTANSSSTASGNQTSVESVVVANNVNAVKNNSSSKEPSFSSNMSSPTRLTTHTSAMADSMTASMYEEAERNLAEEEAQQRKIWERKEEPKPAVVAVNGNGAVRADEKQPATNGHVESNGFLVDFSSGQLSVNGNNGTLISLGVDMNVENKQQNNPFTSSIDHSNSSNMASNAIDLLS